MREETLGLPSRLLASPYSPPLPAPVPHDAAAHLDCFRAQTYPSAAPSRWHWPPRETWQPVPFLAAVAMSSTLEGLHTFVAKAALDPHQADSMMLSMPIRYQRLIRTGLNPGPCPRIPLDASASLLHHTVRPRLAISALLCRAMHPSRFHAEQL